MGGPRSPDDVLFLLALGQAVMAARDRAGMTQEMVAKASHLDRTYVSGIERGVRNPTVTSLRRLAKAVRMRSSQLWAQAEDRAAR